MKITRLQNAQFEPAYGIFCSSLPALNQEGLHPTFCRIPPQGKTIAHDHREPEIFYIISGKGCITIENETAEVRMGDLIQIPSLAKHELTNRSVEDLIFLSVYVLSM